MSEGILAQLQTEIDRMAAELSRLCAELRAKIEYLESTRAANSILRAERDQLRAVNAELVGALKKIENTALGSSCRTIARAAIAKTSAPVREDWLPIGTAPKDGTLVLLLLDHEASNIDHPLDDARFTRTVGHNNFDNDGEDRWMFAGWCWDHDHYTEGRGAPVMWQPMPKAPSAPIQEP